MNTSTHHDDIEGRLSRRLRSTPIELPSAPGPQAAVDRAHQRSRRRRSSLVAVAAVALVGGIAGPMLLGDDLDEGVNTDFASPIDANGIELDWQVHEDGLSMVQSADEGADGFYALSTAPGTRWQDFPEGNVPRALYRWSDGAWQPLELGDDDPHVAKVAERDGTLYALSTAADTGGPVGSMSTDGGETWTSAPLGSIEPPSTTVGWDLNVGLELASTADTTVGVVTTRFQAPVEDLFPELSQETEDCCGYGWRYTQAGVELLEFHSVERGPRSPASTTPDASGRDEIETQEAVVRVVPWSDLGVSGLEALSAVTTYRVDGEAWTPIGDGPAPGVASGTLVSTDTGILIQTYSSSIDSPGPQVFHTIDGTAWQAISTPSSGVDDWSQTVLAPNGHLLHYRAGAGGPEDSFTVSVSTDLGGSWAPIDIRSIVPEIDDYDTVHLNPSSGPLGVALVAHLYRDDEASSELLLFSTDLQSWTTADISTLAPEDTPHLSGPVLVGTDHIVLPMAGASDPDDDQPGPSATLVATPIR